MRVPRLRPSDWSDGARWMSQQLAARFRRALAYHAQERNTLLLVIKSTVAAAVPRRFSAG